MRWCYRHFPDNETRLREMKLLTRDGPAGVRADPQRPADVWARRRAAGRPAKDDEVLFLYFLSHFVHKLSDWRVG